jgi:hypothetical protein
MSLSPGQILRIQPSGTEFLDAETGRQKAPRHANAFRDQNPGSERPEIRAEPPCLAPCRKPAVYEDWMVEVVGLKLVTHHPVIKPVSHPAPGTEIYNRRHWSPPRSGDAVVARRSRAIP